MRRIATVALLLAWTMASVALSGCSSEVGTPPTRERIDAKTLAKKDVRQGGQHQGK